MSNNEQKISDYIDRLNAELKPTENENSTESQELKELYTTLKLVRSLKEPTMPNDNFEKELTNSITYKIAQRKRTKKGRWTLFTGIAGVAVMLVLLFNFLLSFNDSNIVSAMENAFREVKVYHGFLEMVETNAQGESNAQVKMEVWADKQGNYYVKGLEGINKDIITVNNGQQKWQIDPNQKQVHLFAPFPDTYRFAFELGNEVEEVSNALSTKIVGEDIVAGRKTSILEVTPQGGQPYKLWIDTETKLPLQKETAMHNAIQYKITYSEIHFNDTMPQEIISYEVPNGFQEVDNNSEQIVNDLIEAQEIVEFTPTTPSKIPTSFQLDHMAVSSTQKLFSMYYSVQHKDKRLSFVQKKSSEAFTPAPTAILGKIKENIVEIQSPIQKEAGILGGGNPYTGSTNLSSIRWQQDGFEYAVIGNIPLEELAAFTTSITNGEFILPTSNEKAEDQPQVEVPVDLAIEENNQKNVDAGNSPWLLDPIFVAQVFVSLQISPEGIVGDYPIAYEELNALQKNESETIVEVRSDKTSITKVYIKRLIRQDSTGIWTVVGYDQTKSN